MTGIKTYSVQIIDHIKQALLRGDLKPGDKVNEVSLASTLSISRAPVREALQMMVQEGLIESIPQRGKFIKSLSAKDIRDSYFIGGVLEGAAVCASVANFTEDDFRTLEQRLSDMANINEKDQNYAEVFARMDVSFHETLLGKTDNKLIVEQARAICQRMSKFLLFRHWPFAFTHAEILARHQKIFSVVRTRSSVDIERVIREHYIELGERMAPFGWDMQDKTTTSR